MQPSDIFRSSKVRALSSPSRPARDQRRRESKDHQGIDGWNQVTGIFALPEQQVQPAIGRLLDPKRIVFPCCS